jgi:hypothetical protein
MNARPGSVEVARVFGRRVRQHRAFARFPAGALGSIELNFFPGAGKLKPFDGRWRLRSVLHSGAARAPLVTVVTEETETPRIAREPENARRGVMESWVTPVTGAEMPQSEPWRRLSV